MLFTIYKNQEGEYVSIDDECTIEDLERCIKIINDLVQQKILDMVQPTE